MGVTETDQLISFRRALEQIGVRSDTTGREMIKRGELPLPIRRGRYNYFLASDIAKYIERVAATRPNMAKYVESLATARPQAA